MTYYERNKERLKAYQKAYAKEKGYNKSIYNKETRAKYNEANKEKRLAYQRDYQRKKKDKRAYPQPWRNKYQYKAWKEAVYKRDDYTCQECGKTHCTVCAHHIYRGCEYPELRYDINNGITLCTECHISAHTFSKVVQQPS